MQGFEDIELVLGHSKGDHPDSFLPEGVGKVHNFLSLTGDT